MELGEDIMIGHPFFTSYKLRWKRHIVSKVTVELVHFHYPQSTSSCCLSGRTNLRTFMSKLYKDVEKKKQ